MEVLVFDAARPVQNALLCPIPSSVSNSNPRNTQCISVGKIIIFLEIEQKGTFFKDLAGLPASAS
jgi:hypothetical protein